MKKQDIRLEIRKFLSENYGDLGKWSDFDANEFRGSAMRAAMDDMKSAGEGNIEPLGTSRFEKDLDIDDMIADLERAKLNLPNDEKKANSLQKQINHLKRMGAGSLNEKYYYGGEEHEKQFSVPGGKKKYPLADTGDTKTKLTEFFDPEEIVEHDIVYLLEPVDGFKVGDSGAVVHEYPYDDMVEVEFTDEKGNTLGLATVSKDNLSKNVQQQDLNEIDPIINSGPQEMTFELAKEMFEYLDANGEHKLVSKYKNMISDDDISGVIASWATSIKPLEDNIQEYWTRHERIAYLVNKRKNTEQSLNELEYPFIEEPASIDDYPYNTTTLYDFLKDAFYKVEHENLNYAEQAQVFERLLNKFFDIKKKGSVETHSSIHEESNLDEYYTPSNEDYADEMQELMDPMHNYTNKEFVDIFGTIHAILHSRYMNAIKAELIKRGFKIEEPPIGEGNGDSLVIKKGMNAKPMVRLMSETNGIKDAVTLSDFVAKYNIVKTGKNGTVSLSDVDKVIGSFTEQELFNLALSFANIYLSRKLGGMSWDDLPDINSLWDVAEKGMSAKEIFDGAVDYAKQRISEAGGGDLFGEEKIKQEGDGISLTVQKAVNVKPSLTNEGHHDFVSQFNGIHDGNPMQKNEYLNALGLDEKGIETLQMIVNTMSNDEHWRKSKYPNGATYVDEINNIQKVVGNLKEFLDKYQSVNPIKIVNYLKGKINELN